MRGPAEWESPTTPEVPGSGKHVKIEEWRFKLAEKLLRERRLDKLGI